MEPDTRLFRAASYLPRMRWPQGIDRCKIREHRLEEMGEQGVYAKSLEPEEDQDNVGLWLAVSAYEGDRRLGLAYRHLLNRLQFPKRASIYCGKSKGNDQV